MDKLVDFLVRRSQREYSVMVRAVATLLGATLFVGGIPAFIIWVGKTCANHPVLPVLPARILSGTSFALGLPWMIWAIAWQLIKGKGTPVPIVPTKHFLRSGPYRFVRNPMMLGFFFYLFGWALWWNKWGSIFSAIGIVALICVAIKRIEEPELAKRFGDSYREYKKEIPFIVPKLRLK